MPVKYVRRRTAATFTSLKLSVLCRDFQVRDVSSGECGVASVLKLSNKVGDIGRHSCSLRGRPCLPTALPWGACESQDPSLTGRAEPVELLPAAVKTLLQLCCLLIALHVRHPISLLGAELVLRSRRTFQQAPGLGVRTISVAEVGGERESSAARLAWPGRVVSGCT